MREYRVPLIIIDIESSMKQPVTYYAEDYVTSRLKNVIHLVYSTNFRFSPYSAAIAPFDR